MMGSKYLLRREGTVHVFVYSWEFVIGWILKFKPVYGIFQGNVQNYPILTSV